MILAIALADSLSSYCRSEYRSCGSRRTACPRNLATYHSIGMSRCLALSVARLHLCACATNGLSWPTTECCRGTLYTGKPAGDVGKNHTSERQALQSLILPTPSQGLRFRPVSRTPFARYQIRRKPPIDRYAPIREFSLGWPGNRRAGSVHARPAHSPRLWTRAACAHLYRDWRGAPDPRPAQARRRPRETRQCCGPAAIPCPLLGPSLAAGSEDWGFTTSERSRAVGGLVARGKLGGAALAAILLAELALVRRFLGAPILAPVDHARAGSDRGGGRACCASHRSCQAGRSARSVCVGGGPLGVGFCPASGCRHRVAAATAMLLVADTDGRVRTGHRPIDRIGHPPLADQARASRACRGPLAAPATGSGNPAHRSRARHLRELQARARSACHCGGDRPQRGHHVGQRQILHDIRLLAHGTDREHARPHQFRRAPARHLLGAVAVPRQRADLARRVVQPHEGGRSLLGGHDHRAAARCRRPH